MKLVSVKFTCQKKAATEYLIIPQQYTVIFWFQIKIWMQWQWCYNLRRRLSFLIWQALCFPPTVLLIQRLQFYLFVCLFVCLFVATLRLHVTMVFNFVARSHRNIMCLQIYSVWKTTGGIFKFLIYHLRKPSWRASLICVPSILF